VVKREYDIIINRITGLSVALADANGLVSAD